TIHHIPYTIYHTPYTIYHIPYTIHHTPYTIHRSPSGDVILTGTPHGVGYAMNPPQCLKAGDHMKIEIEHIGVLENEVRD
ncbi:hypothetical protein EON63_25190, partial [archaeon]